MTTMKDATDRLLDAQEARQMRSRQLAAQCDQHIAKLEAAKKNLTILGACGMNASGMTALSLVEECFYHVAQARKYHDQAFAARFGAEF